MGKLNRCFLKWLDKTGVFYLILPAAFAYAVMATSTSVGICRTVRVENAAFFVLFNPSPTLLLLETIMKN